MELSLEQGGGCECHSLQWGPQHRQTPQASDGRTGLTMPGSHRWRPVPSEGQYACRVEWDTLQSPYGRSGTPPRAVQTPPSCLTQGLLGIISTRLPPRLTHTNAYLNWLASDRWMRWH